MNDGIGVGLVRPVNVKEECIPDRRIPANDFDPDAVSLSEEQLVRYYGAYSNVSRGKRKKEKVEEEPTKVTEFPPPPVSKELRRRWSYFIRTGYFSIADCPRIFAVPTLKTHTFPRLCESFLFAVIHARSLSPDSGIPSTVMSCEICLRRRSVQSCDKSRHPIGHPLAGRSRSTNVSCVKNFLLSPFFLLAQSVIFR